MAEINLMHLSLKIWHIWWQQCWWLSWDAGGTLPSSGSNDKL